MKALYLIWQDAEDRRWYPVGRLTVDLDGYAFVYTRGALLSKRFIPFGRMNDLHTKYLSKQLFPLFSNRILPRSRPEYPEYVNWAGLDEQSVTPFDLLARTGGMRATDQLLIHPVPEKDEMGRYVNYFFCHGIRHMDSTSSKRLESVNIGEKLYPMLDVQNMHDSHAIALRTGDPAAMIGYIPRFFTKDFEHLASYNLNMLKITVEKLNADAPFQLRLMCKVEAPWPDGFSPCSDELYEALA